MTPRKTLLAALALLLLIMLSAWITVRRGSDTAEDETAGSMPLVGSAAPDFTLRALDGREVKLSSYRRKGPVVLAFWASWCGPCQMEMPLLETFYRQNHGRGVELLAISIDSDPAAARRFAEEHKLPFPVLLDSRNEVADNYQAQGIPLLYVVDPSGKLRYSHSGFNPAYEEMLTREVDAVR
jgi:peroxiredoxin